jgi:hypothetical protein
MLLLFASGNGGAEPVDVNPNRVFFTFHRSRSNGRDENFLLSTLVSMTLVQSGSTLERENVECLSDAGRVCGADAQV